MDLTVHSPFVMKGTMIWCVNTPSGTVPMVSPAVTLSPTLTAGVKSQFRSGMGFRYTPLSRKKPHCFARSGRGFWSPS